MPTTIYVEKIDAESIGWIVCPILPGVWSAEIRFNHLIIFPAILFPTPYLAHRALGYMKMNVRIKNMRVIGKLIELTVSLEPVTLPID